MKMRTICFKSHSSEKKKRKRRRVYRRVGCDVGLNQVAEMRVVFEPFVVFFIRESLVPAKKKKKLWIYDG